MSEQEKKDQKKTPWIRLASAFYRAENGEHPKLANADLYTFEPVLDELMEDHLIEYDLPITPCIDGHNVMTTNGIASFLDNNIKIPLSPNFVKDLAGRVIYIGYGPEIKQTQDWPNNRHVTFPKNCRIVTTDIEGSDYIENIFLTRFRTLDVSISYEDEAHQKYFCYEAENLYPYKLRLDTFYQDGWRLPQTNMLYARKSSDQNKAKTVGLKFIEEWEKSSDIESYREFLKNRGGEDWLEKLFQAGCTVIPTHEAYNSYFIVNSAYEIERRRSGTAVQSLHQILDEKASEEPKGTILEVIQPGFVTSTYIQPAQVIVSDGKRYEATKKAYSLLQYPDLRLPHQRTQSVWGATWLPTHPSHFDAPAIWGWDMATGHFLQTSGPLWDPLHYYYESTPLVIKSFKNHVSESKHIAHVPEVMKERFYPVSCINGFDMTSYNTLKMRHEKNIHPKSAILRVNDTQPSSTLGYHPLPYNFEYELNHLWFPELMPNKRTPMMPKSISLMPVIHSNLSPEHYIHNAVDNNEAERLYRPNLVKDVKRGTLENYPHLHKYLSDFSPEVANIYGGVTLNIPQTFIENVNSLYVSDDLDEIIKATEMPFYKAVKDFRERSFTRLNKTIESFNGNVVGFIHKFWKGES
jgi:hypothetical protein